MATIFDGKMKVLIILMWTMLVFSPESFGGAISASIVTNPDGDVLPLEVEFSTQVTGGTPPYSYVWSFGDGGSSTFETQSHYFRESGMYTVHLAVVDAQGAYTVCQKQAVISAMAFDMNNTVSTLYTCTQEVKALIADKDDPNVIWIGTMGGLMRKNTQTGEKRLYAQELPGTWLSSLLQSSDGKIWVGTLNDGLACLDQDTGAWMVYSYDNGEFSGNWVPTLFQSSDSVIWAGTAGGLARLDPDTNQWSDISVNGRSDEITSIIQTSDGAIWVGSGMGMGLARRDPVTGGWTEYKTDNSDLPDDGVNALFQTSDGALWVGTYDGLGRLDLDTNQWTIYNTSNSPLADNEIYSLLQTSDGAIWCGTGDGWGNPGGIARFDMDANQWTTYNESTGLSGDIVNSLLQTSDGEIWAGTGNGLVQFDADTNHWNIFVFSNSLPGIGVHFLYQTSDDAIWVASGGLARLDPITGMWDVYNADNSGIPNAHIESVFETSDGYLWICSDEGLARFDMDANQWTIYNASNSGLPNNDINSLIQTSDGALWIGTGAEWNNTGSLVRFDMDANQWTVYNTSNSGLPNNVINCLIQASDGALWSGTDSGLVRYDVDANQWSVYNTSNSGLHHDQVKGIVQTSDGAIWCGTGDGWSNTGGLVRFDMDANQWTVHDEIGGQNFTDITSILHASDGALWVGDGYSGLARLDPITKGWYVFDTEKDLPDNEIYSLLQSSDGAIWVGTDDEGLVRLDFPTSSHSVGKLILVAGGGAARINTLWPTTLELARNAYSIFHTRGFKNTDIFLMSPDKWFDFNNDGFDDHVVDCPGMDEDRNLTISDVEYAITDWAISNTVQAVPLYVYLMDHGYPDDGIHGPYFQTAPGENLYAPALDAMLDAYEQATGGQVIVINESCYSGEFLPYLKKPGRVVISAARDNLVNYGSRGAQSFSHYFLRYLYANNSLQQAFAKAGADIKEGANTSGQSPQLDDNADGLFDISDGRAASNIKLGGDYVFGDAWPGFQSVENGGLISASMVFTGTTTAHMQRVWATVQAPDYVPDTSGGFGLVDLPYFNLEDAEGNLAYKGQYDDFTQTGVYKVTLYAKDYSGNVEHSDPVLIPVGLGGTGTVQGAVNLAMGNYEVNKGNADITVLLAGTQLQTTVDSSGQFTIYGVTPGAHTLEISGPQFDTVTISDLEVAADQTLDVPVQQLTLNSGAGALSGDFNGDGKRGLPDAVYILQETAGQRP